MRGNPFKLGDEVPRHFLSVLSAADAAAVHERQRPARARRRIVHQPIAMRVIVNRIWKGHFGTGLVDTPSNFGVDGERPSNPELLEYLAQWFVDDGMSIKKLHREIMLSAVYQLSADDVAANFEKDSGNRFYWRANRHRMTAEQVRDSLLFVSGALDTKMGGPSEPLTPSCNRRTVYGKVSRYRLDEFLQLFDFPSPNLSAEQRFTTSVPLQRLFFMNSDFMQQQGELLARAGRGRAGQDRADSEGVPADLRARRRPTRRWRPGSPSSRRAAEGSTRSARREGREGRRRTRRTRPKDSDEDRGRTERQTTAPKSGRRHDGGRDSRRRRSRRRRKKLLPVTPCGPLPQGAPQLERVPVRELTYVHEHTSPRNRSRDAMRCAASATASACWRSPAWSAIAGPPPALAIRIGRPSHRSASSHHPARAKHVIFLFMNGGLSQVDSFDPKPMLDKYHGQPLPGGTVATERKTGALMRSPFTFKKYGQCGMDVSELFPHVGECADDICFIRSVYTDIPNHEPSMLMMNTGHTQVGRPSLGSWLTYGLGTREPEPARLRRALSRHADHGRPAAVEQRVPAGGASGHLHRRQGREGDRADRRQGFRSEEARSPTSTTTSSRCTEQRRELDLLEQLDRMRCSATRCRIRSSRRRLSSMETAYRMQTEAPEVFDIRKESEATLKLYGPGSTARGCLMAVRLVERGVRMVQVYYAKGDPWDAHARHPGAPQERQGLRSAVRRGDQGSEVARPVRGHAGDLRIGVRPHAGDGDRRRRRQRRTAAITTRSGSRCGWPAAASRAARSTAPPTISASRRSRSRSTSTTCTPPSCTSWASITPS